MPCERIDHLIDEGTFVEHDEDMTSADPLKFQGPKSYKEKLKADQESTDLKDAVITGHGTDRRQKSGDRGDRFTFYHGFHGFGCR